MSGELTLFLVCCGWPTIGILIGWWLRGAYEQRRAIGQTE